MMFAIQPYSPQKRPDWDAFVDSSRNATFLFRRDYMDYHADRFTDFSLMARDGKGRVVALLPASRHGDEVRSHGGLTYGGWLLANPGLDTSGMLALWSDMVEYFRSCGVRRLVYKPVPHIYHIALSEEDLYALYSSGAVLSSRMVSSVLDLSLPTMFNHSAPRNLRNALRAGLTTGQSDDWEGYWSLLSDVLRERYGAQPVHILAEILQLHDAFPSNIRLHTVVSPSGEMIGGVVIYDTGRVIHTQYIAASAEGRRTGALALLFHDLIEQERARGSARYLDLGTSNGHDALTLNEGLIAQKASYGAHALAHDTYTLDIDL